MRGRFPEAGGPDEIAAAKYTVWFSLNAQLSTLNHLSPAGAPRDACTQGHERPTLAGCMIGLHEGKGSKVRAKKPVERTLLLRLQVVACEPPVWRRLLVRESMWLSRLHDAIQVAFDWFDYQTHAFNLDDLRYGNPLKRDELTIEDDRDITLAELDLEHHGRFTYGYHFGEGWQVEIKLEKIGTVERGHHYPACLGGERAGPPEDCGGIDAYHDMLACLKEPHTELGREWREWLGPDYDPEACDPARINAALKKIGK